VMRIFELQRGIVAPVRILTATYAHNQQYYDQADWHTKLRKRRMPEQKVQSQIRQAAHHVASLLKAAEKIREAAEDLRNVRIAPEAGQETAKTAPAAADPKAMKEQLRQLLSAYNTALQMLEEAQPYVKRAVRNQFSQAAVGYQIYGIHQQADGTLELDEELLESQLRRYPEQMIQALAGRNGLADKLAAQAEKLAREPASALLGPLFHPQSPLPEYRYQMLRGNTFRAGMLIDFVI